MPYSGLVAGASKGIEGKHPGQVDESSGDRRDRDPADAGRVSPIQGARALSREGIDPSFGPGQDVWRGRRAAQETMEVGGGQAEEDRARAAGHHCRQVRGLAAGGNVSHPVDARVLDYQSAASNAPRD